ncbi:hypothetical protein GH714_016794 [Hevea brasiliensis]|uniref:Gamma-tubulin complex component n=1 Tax=Hevea brasiliensis TaxID=3981 RepID=A0A6A6KDL6_HEVBR|nr:hypothetical protein GH714_016794 [Hevea brasiliensis]
MINPSLVLITGDLTDGKSKDLLVMKQNEDEWLEYQNIIEDVVKRSGLDKNIFYDLRGNHDIFGVPVVGGSFDFFSKYSINGQLARRGNVNSVTLETGERKHLFIGLDTAMSVGLRGPTNLFGHPTDQLLTQLDSQLSQWDSQTNKPVTKISFGHFPLSFSASSHSGKSLKDIFLNHSISAYLCGHLHARFGSAKNCSFGAPSAEEFWEWEMGDWRKSRAMRIMAIDRGHVSYLDIDFKSGAKKTIVLPTFPLDSRFMSTSSWHQKYECQHMVPSSYETIRALVFSVSPIVSVVARIYDARPGTLNIVLETPMTKVVVDMSRGDFYAAPWNHKAFDDPSPDRFWLQIEVIDIMARSTLSELRPFSVNGLTTKISWTWKEFFVMGCQWAELYYPIFWTSAGFPLHGLEYIGSPDIMVVVLPHLIFVVLPATFVAGALAAERGMFKEHFLSLSGKKEDDDSGQMNKKSQVLDKQGDRRLKFYFGRSDADRNGSSTLAVVYFNPSLERREALLTGRFHQETKGASRLAGTKGLSLDSFSPGIDKAIGCYDAAVQELIVIDNLMSALVGIEGQYVKRVHGKEDEITFQIDASMDLALQERAKWIFPLCESYLLIDQFVESRSQFKSGVVNHAFAAALRALLLDYQAMVAQLEHQFRLGKLSIQGLWFYCQPLMGSMQALSTVVKKASANNFTGSAVLNLLQSQAKAMAGDSAVRSLLEKMTHCASNAYLGILESFLDSLAHNNEMYFLGGSTKESSMILMVNFSLQRKSLHKESLTQDYDAKYWRQRYSLKEGIPSFLANIAGTILTTGKYLNVMRECGHNVQYDLMGKLLSLKHYLLLDQGDFLVHFTDIARDELTKKLDEISVEKLQSLLDLALRTTAAAADPCHEDLTCCVERSSLLKTLGNLKDLGTRAFPDNNDLEEPMSITGLETFSLSYKVQWPLSIVISKKALTKYQLIFRFLFHCKHVDRQLCGAWQVHQGVRALNMRGTAIPRSALLCRSMLKFINSLLHYLTFEVLEPNWHMMYNKMQTAKSIDEVIQYHDLFLDKCLKECLLLLPELLKKVERLKLVCLQYAAASQWLISSSIDIPKLEEPSDVSLRSEKSKQWRSRSQSQAVKMMTQNTTVTESILKFEREFNAELQSLGPILSSNSQAEPYLTHLAQWILGIRNDQ